MTAGVRSDHEAPLTSVEQAEERLRARMLIVSQWEHKLKTAFAVISGWSHSLENSWELLTDEQRREGVAAIRKRADEVVAQAQALLHECHAEVAALEIRPVPLDLAEVLRTAAATFGGSSERHRCEYVGQSTVRTSIDPAALQQILGQLLENAVKYSPDGETIRLSARHTRRGVEMSVADEGVGIPDSVDIFAPFERGPSEHPVQGTGIGLYIVANLVSAMGGTINASRNPTGGSTFTIEFPYTLP